MKTRASGILLHLTSLPSPFGMGDLGPGAHRFVEFLVEAKQSYWQFLPLNPTDAARGFSPYQSPSAFAGNPQLISPELLVQDGLIEPDEILGRPFSEGEEGFEQAIDFKNSILETAFRRFSPEDAIFQAFCQKNSTWLDDYALFSALGNKYPNQYWDSWPEAIRDRHPEAMRVARQELFLEIRREKFLQFQFMEQWSRLRSRGRSRGISFIGDLPIYVDYHSAEVWANPALFKLDQDRRPRFVSGVPPDYFSETGQLWGNPVYDWDEIRKTGYDWWLRRFERALDLMDFIRIDHFRGLSAYWEVPAGQDTAINGSWVPAPGRDFLTRVARSFPSLPFIAEDLGVIDSDVRELISHFGLPGMKILLFAFGDDLGSNPFAPHNHTPNSVVFTGTHDNNTVRGWLENEAAPEEKNRLFQYLGREVEPRNISWEFIRLALASVANTVILPLQDVLGCGQEGRMNRPGSIKGNWLWRVDPLRLTSDLAGRLREMTEIFGRG
ncbi:MAG: 4-alpha-glucanotransferase [Pseudomonadota bacterium]